MDVLNQLRALARSSAALLVIASFAACGGSAKIEPGLYRAVLTVPGGELPFGFELAQRNGAWLAYLVNGAQRVEITQVSVEGSRLEMIMPGYLNRLSARARDGKLQGEVTLVRRGGKERQIPFSATRAQSHRFSREPLTDNADVAGRWAVEFIGEDNSRSSAVGEFRQKFHEVTGTFRTSTGDFGHLAGEMHDDELWLSTFDGARAYLFKAKVTADGELAGTWWSGDWSRDTFTARRDPDAALQDPDRITQISDATWQMGFTFADESGRPVSMADARFRGKVVIVTLAGSWCPNSHDAVAYLARLYREQRERGVEVVALMFEHFDDFDEAARAVKALRAHFDVQHPTLIAGMSDKADAARKLPQLNGVFSFPTLLFFDRQGRVRRIYTGFDGPATGEHYERMTQSFAETVDTLLAEEKQPTRETGR